MLSSNIVRDDAGTPAVFVRIKNTGSVQLTTWSVVICLFDTAGTPIYVDDRYLYNSCLSAQSILPVSVGMEQTDGWVFSEAPSLDCVAVYFYGSTYPGGVRQTLNEVPPPERLRCPD